jgi:hypothetical protein
MTTAQAIGRDRHRQRPLRLEIVEMHGDGIGFAAHPEQGTTFWFSAPVPS